MILVLLIMCGVREGLSTGGNILEDSLEFQQREQKIGTICGFLFGVFFIFILAGTLCHFLFQLEKFIDSKEFKEYKIKKMKSKGSNGKDDLGDIFCKYAREN
jgi:hypothetical protein